MCSRYDMSKMGGTQMHGGKGARRVERTLLVLPPRLDFETSSDLLPLQRKKCCTTGQVRVANDMLLFLESEPLQARGYGAPWI